LLHEPDEVPLLPHLGFKVSAGFSTSVAVKVTEVSLCPFHSLYSIEFIPEIAVASVIICTEIFSESQLSYTDNDKQSWLFRIGQLRLILTV